MFSLKFILVAPFLILNLSFAAGTQNYLPYLQIRNLPLKLESKDVADAVPDSSDENHPLFYASLAKHLFLPKQKRLSKRKNPSKLNFLREDDDYSDSHIVSDDYQEDKVHIHLNTSEVLSQKDETSPPFYHLRQRVEDQCLESCTSKFDRWCVDHTCKKADEILNRRKCLRSCRRFLF